MIWLCFLTVMSLRNSKELTNDDKHMSNDNQRQQLNYIKECQNSNNI